MIYNKEDKNGVKLTVKISGVTPSGLVNLYIYANKTFNILNLFNIKYN